MCVMNGKVLLLCSMSEKWDWKFLTPIANYQNHTHRSTYIK